MLLVVLDLEVLVRECVAVDRLAAGAGSVGEVTTLSHEAFDYSVKLAPFVAQFMPQLSHSFLAGAECTEVLHSFWHRLTI